MQPRDGDQNPWQRPAQQPPDPEPTDPPPPQAGPHPAQPPSMFQPPSQYAQPAQYGQSSPYGQSTVPDQSAPPQYGPPSQSQSQSQYGPPSQPQYGQPPYGPPAQPQYGQPQYGQPQYGQPQYGQAQYGQPQYGQPPYGSPQYGSQPNQTQQYGTQQYGTQQYGQPSPPYGAYQPGPTPARKVNKKAIGIIAALVAVVVIVGGIAYAITQLGSHKLSHTAVENTIEQQSTDTSKSFRVITDVNCNNGKDIAVKKNASFTCTAAGNVHITVVIKSSTSNPDWVWAVD